MPTTVQQVCEFLDEFDLKYRVLEDDDAIAIGFGVDEDETSYRDKDGDPHVQLVIRLVEEGEFLALFAPMAWCLDGCPHIPAVMTAFIGIQSQFKMIRFDFDPSDGEVRPNIELPLEDAELTSRQLHRGIAGMLQVLQRFDPVIRTAMTTGVVSFEEVGQERRERPSRETRRLRRLAERAGGVDELEKLLGGDGPAEGPAEDAASGDHGSDEEDRGQGPARQAG